MFGLFGLICGILYAFGGLVIDILVSMNILSATSMSTPGLSYGSLLAFGALIAMPAIGISIGLLVGLVESLLYNFYQKWFGGIKVDLKH